MGVGVTSLLLILGVFCSASSADQALADARECLQSGQQCFAPLEAAVSGMSFQEVLSAINNTDLSVTCGAILSIRDCVRNVITECQLAELDDPRVQEGLRMLRLTNYGIDYICVDHIDVFNEHKGCLLRMSSGPFQVPQILLDVEAQCEMPHAGPGRGLCIPASYPDCAAGIVQQQCGAEIATAIRDLDQYLTQEVGTCEGRRLFRMMKERQMKKKQMIPTLVHHMKKTMYSPQELMHKTFPALF